MRWIFDNFHLLYRGIATYCIQLLQVCEVRSCVLVVWLFVFSKVDKNVSFLYNAPFSLCHVSKCEMIIYVYTDAFIRSHESNQVALLITESTGSSLWRFFTFLVARYVVFLTTCGAADAVRLSMLTDFVFHWLPYNIQINSLLPGSQW